MEVIKHFSRLSGLIQALLISWMIYPAIAEGRVLEYKPLDFGLRVAGIHDSEIECLTRNIYFEAATEDWSINLQWPWRPSTGFAIQDFSTPFAELSTRVRESSTKSGPVNFPGFMMERVTG